MDTDGDRIERRISEEAAARYARTSAATLASGSRTLAPVHHGQDTPPAVPERASPLRRPPIPMRDPVRDPVILRSVPPAPLRAPPSPLERTQEVITLDQVRTGRRQNEYVDSPQLAAIRSVQSNTHHPHANKSLHTPYGVDRTVGEHPSGGSIPAHDTVINVQPQSSALKKDVIDSEDHVSRPTPCHDSFFICSQCGKCRCQACTQPRELPRRWFCNNKCECSMQKMVDVCSCLCVVQACFYHCCAVMEGDDYSAADDPCACCERPYCCRRWACMSLCLPCLCLYWPLRCGLAMCTSVYNKCSRKGCHCHRDNKLPGSKRLLIDSESSST